ncbi:class I SAM-dependent methyltransferase [Acidithiobacillus ferridurans]|uniref:class I SAM-dependent methyltransferase n=1 Tax=Acidithiobacillus ferridurans TaxID=1232575 RepID=UPI001C0790E5|nr:class I SAM-dependent methyltransferase [Acidithiobacillus ferridurans]
MTNDVFSRLSTAAFQVPLHQSSITAWQGHIPFALWCMEQWRPKIFVELGTHLGDSYFAFCQSVKEHSTGTQCFAVDTWQGDAHTGAYGGDIYEHVLSHNQQQYQDFSHLLRMTFDEALDQFADGSVDLLHIDGLHTYDAVRHDFETWFPKLSPQAVVVFHDSNVYEKDFGVWRFVRELDARFPHFHFFHSHGLSIFPVGEKAPETARWIAGLSPSEGDDWRLIFSRLGDCVVQRAQSYFQQMQFQHELQRRDETIRELNQK